MLREHKPLVLVAEDEDELRTLISLRLSSAGLHVRELEDGLELADYIALAQKSSQRLPMPHLILTDVRMPGATGLEVIRTIRSQELDFPIVVLTAYPDDQLVEDAERLGDTQVVSKPIDLDALADIVWHRLWAAAARR